MPDTSPSLFGETPQKRADQPQESSDKLLEQTGWGKDIRDFYNAAVDEGVPPEFESLMAKIAKKIK